MSFQPQYFNNGILCLYNMFPFRAYTDDSIGIDSMIAYVSNVADMGYNAVWVNPLQKTGTVLQPHPHDSERGEVSGSLYAMADDVEFNPLLFPGCDTKEQCEDKLCKWTAAVRLQGMFPLFDLVLNHVGVNADGPTPLQLKLDGLLLSEINKQWPDIQEIDYYRADPKKRDINTTPEDLDPDKIDQVFIKLWEPLIRRYILDYGFMGVRVSALPHVPAIVQQRAYQLVQQLVQEKFNTEALIVGELMASKPEPYLKALSTCGLTHCLNPFSFNWGPNLEGGYANNSRSSSFLRLNRQLPEIVLSPPQSELSDYIQLIISNEEFNPHERLDPRTIYIFKSSGMTHIALNYEKNDLQLGKALITPLNNLSEATELERLLYRHYIHENHVLRLFILRLLQHSVSLQSLMYRATQQMDIGGLIGVVGNHDLGSLKAKVMLDSAYTSALHHAGTNEAKISQIKQTFKACMHQIKSAKNTDHLITLLQTHFCLDESDISQLKLDIDLRMREKLFIQAMACLGGWYSLAGDELGVCHKPDVFEQYAHDPSRMGPSLTARAKSLANKPDLRCFIKGINAILHAMPQPTYNDRATIYFTELTSQECGEKAPDLLFLVVRYNAKMNKYFLLCHSNEFLSECELHTKIANMLGREASVKVNNSLIVILNCHGELATSTWIIQNTQTSTMPCSSSSFEQPNIHDVRFFALKELPSTFGNPCRMTTPPPRS